MGVARLLPTPAEVAMSTLLETLLEQTAAQRAPFAEGAPGGVDISFEPELEPLSVEIDKLGSLNGVQVNWRAVRHGAEQLLATRTKDIRLAVWWAVATLDLKSWLHLARALVVLRSLLTEHWDAAFPSAKRPKARANHAVWLYEQAKEPLASFPITAADGDAVKLCDSLFHEVDAVLRAQLGNGVYSGLGSLQGILQQCVGSIPARPPPPPVFETPPPLPEEIDLPPALSTPELASAPVAVVASPALSLPSSTQPSEPVDVETADEDPAEAAGPDGTLAEGVEKVQGQISSLGSLGRRLGEAEPTRALAYRLTRAGAWLALDDLPGRGGMVASPPSSFEVRGAIQRLLEEGDWGALVQQAEDELLETSLWLDLQRYVATALERLGPGCKSARDEVGAACVALVHRHPHVLSYLFDDSSPVADDETRAWFAAEAKRWVKSGTWLFDEDVAVDRRLRDARELLATGQVEEALGLAAEVARRGADPRARFEGQLALARLAMEGEAHDIARPLLEASAKLVEYHKIDAWEPALAVAVYEQLVRCLRTDAGRAGLDDAPAREAAFLEKLCCLEPAAALRAVKRT